MPSFPNLLLVGVMIPLLLAGSFAAWGEMLRRWYRGQSLVEPVTAALLPRPFWAVICGVAWVGLNLADRIVVDLEPQTQPVSASLVTAAFLQTSFTLLVMWLLLFGSGRFRPHDAGLRLAEWRVSCGYGVDAFLATLLPTALVLLATFPLRSAETQHPLLRVLETTGDRSIILMLALTVVFVGPLAEELLFRVTLQGWLTRRCGRRFALVSVAVLFAIVHGWKDGIALLPLSFLLGYLYDRRQDLLAITVAHGLFNAVNLLILLLSLGE